MYGVAPAADGGSRLRPLTHAIGWLLGKGGRLETVRFADWRVNANSERDVDRAEDRL